MSKKLNVFLLDGLCMSPWYDLYLYKALSEYVNVVFGCITFHLEILDKLQDFNKIGESL